MKPDLESPRLRRGIDRELDVHNPGRAGGFLAIGGVQFPDAAIVYRRDAVGYDQHRRWSYLTYNLPY